MALVEAGAAEGFQQLVLNPFALTPQEALSAVGSHAAYASRRVTRWSELPSARRWTALRLGDFRPHVVHVHLFHALALVATIRPYGAVRVVSHQHGDHLLAEGRRFLARIDRAAGTRFDQVVACSHWVRSFLRKEYKYPAELVTTIQNGWAGTPLVRRSAHEPTLVCVARLRRQKGHEVLLQAFRRVVGHLPDAQLVLVGDGPERANITGTAASLGVTKNVKFLGEVADVWPVLARSDVFVLASSYEPLGIAILEAMAAGVPVVASAVGGIPELVKDGVTGYLVPPHDEQRLAEAILKLLASKSLRERMGHAAEESAAGQSMERMLRAYFGLYQRLLDAQKSA
ncbi:MAG: glycosyltransferase [Actinomycetota bacterium]|nr:glycosyltransferase [Actinomycetota bacterium]